MVKHIIIWTLKDCYDASQKAEIAKNIKKDLEKYGVNVLLSEKSKSPYKNY